MFRSSGIIAKNPVQKPRFINKLNFVFFTTAKNLNFFRHLLTSNKQPSILDSYRLIGQFYTSSTAINNYYKLYIEYSNNFNSGHVIIYEKGV